MLGPTHGLIALTGAVVIASQTTSDYTQAGVLIGASVATAKLPDVDCRIPGLPHRGPATHSLLAGFLVAFCAMTATAFVSPEFAPLVGAGVALGVVLHILADAMTISGVPALWPVVRDDVHLLPRGFRVRTGASMEAVLAFLLLAGLLGFVWMTYA